MSHKFHRWSATLVTLPCGLSLELAATANELADQWDSVGRHRVYDGRILCRQGYYYKMRGCRFRFFNRRPRGRYKIS